MPLGTVYKSSRRKIHACQNPHVAGLASPEVNHRFVYMKNWVTEEALTNFLRKRMIVLGKGYS